MGIKNIVAAKLPFLGKYKRLAKVYMDTTMPLKKSYSQYGEDKIIVALFEKLNIPADAIYVDVGANHPTDISNTYLLYRKGYHGIIIEPNQEFIGLFKKFRPKDTALGVGCANKAAILQFSISKTPVISSFVNDDNAIDVYRKEYLPVMPLDTILENIPFRSIGLLSIDVEGLNYDVLLSAMKTVSKSAVLCVEFDNAAEEQKITALVSPHMVLHAKLNCNLIFVHRSFAEKLGTTASQRND